MDFLEVSILIGPKLSKSLKIEIRESKKWTFVKKVIKIDIFYKVRYIRLLFKYFTYKSIEKHTKIGLDRL